MKKVLIAALIATAVLAGFGYRCWFSDAGANPAEISSSGAPGSSATTESDPIDPRNGQANPEQLPPLALQDAAAPVGQDELVVVSDQSPFGNLGLQHDQDSGGSYEGLNDLAVFAISNPVAFADKAKGWGQTELKANYEELDAILVSQLKGELPEDTQRLSEVEIQELKTQVDLLASLIEK